MTCIVVVENLLHFAVLFGRTNFSDAAILPGSMRVRGLGTLHRARYFGNAITVHAQVLEQQQPQHSEPKVVVTWEFLQLFRMGPCFIYPYYIWGGII